MWVSSFITNGVRRLDLNHSFKLSKFFPVRGLHGGRIHMYLLLRELLTHSYTGEMSSALCIFYSFPTESTAYLLI